MTSEQRRKRIAELHAAQKRDWFLRGSGIAVGVMIALAWFTSRPLLGRLSAERRWTNFKNFAGELIPRPVQESGQWSDALPWANDLLRDGGWEALGNTIAIATVAIILSAVFVLPFLILASRKLSRPDPLGLPAGQSAAPVKWFWTLVGPIARFGFVVARSVPEYLIAFLLLSLLGLQVWPLILALAIHNFGILGRLWGEVVENESSDSAPAILASGASRGQVFGLTIFPEVFNRFLIYFFYRWETCVKDATVLGMLGLLTLGKLIILAKGFFWDEMFFYILLGSSIILVGDVISSLVRSRIR